MNILLIKAKSSLLPKFQRSLLGAKSGSSLKTRTFILLGWNSFEIHRDQEGLTPQGSVLWGALPDLPTGEQRSYYTDVGLKPGSSGHGLSAVGTGVNPLQD